MTIGAPVYILDAQSLLPVQVNSLPALGRVGAAGSLPFALCVEDQAALLAAAATPVVGAVVIAPGTPVAAGRKVAINCSARGTLRLKLANGSFWDMTVETGQSIIDEVAVVDVVSANTTAVATVTVLA